MRNIIKWCGKHILVVILGSIVYMLSFHLDFLNLTGIYFYDGIVRLLVTLIVVGLLEFLLRKRLCFDYKDIVLSICLFCLLNMLWLSLCVVSLDRSLSVFVLCYMDEIENVTGNGMTEEELQDVFDKVFVDEYGMLERRYEEQLASGNIVKSGEGYILTDRGEFITSVFRIVGKMYNVDERFIYPDVE
ncbi:MAG: hypothetical protein E7289_01870 [Lachnospiraceae bacterium]|nr:hypothetical protein [Lachnospiraceae bacterium]